MANSADPDQTPTDLDLYCLQRQGISWFSRTRVEFAHYKLSRIYSYNGTAPDMRVYPDNIFPISPRINMLYIKYIVCTQGCILGASESNF